MVASACQQVVFFLKLFFLTPYWKETSLPFMYYQVFRWFPKSAFSRLMGWLASLHPPQVLLKRIIGLYVLIFRIDMRQFIVPEGGFGSFNEFFIRPLAEGAREIASGKGEVPCPVDGTVSELGPITQGKLIQAKGIDYALADLLGGEPNTERFEGGDFITVYLSPKDYHRIHSPLDGKVTRFRYVPGELWTVSPAGVRGVKGLFARNERVITPIESPLGEVMLVKVGATIVGKVEVAFSDVTTNIKHAKTRAETLEKPFPVSRGQEIARFLLGSTIILIFPPGAVKLEPLKPGDAVRLGQKIATHS